jgi:hypothetical protein
MKNKLLTGFALIGLAGIIGCGNKNKQNTNTNRPDHFASIPTKYNSGMALTSGDFDGDGDIDIIAGSYMPGYLDKAGLYFFQNDGKGRFTLVNEDNLRAQEYDRNQSIKKDE